MSRRLRFLAALVALAGVLFAQLAVPAHACAVGLGGAADHACCESPEGEGEALCQAHCQQGGQLLDKPATPAATPPGASPHAAAPAAAVPIPPRTPSSLLARATGPSAALALCRLRF